MRIALVQLTSTDNLSKNLESARCAVREAAESGAEFIALPENFAFLRREGSVFPCAQGLDGEIVGVLRELARRHGIWLLGGTFPEAIPGQTRIHNTSVLIEPSWDLNAIYRKIHLFDVDLRDSGGGPYVESAYVAAGEEVVVAETPFGGVGMSVCYDLRFPEIYRRMADHGACFLTVPSAFTRETGKDHWEVLLRARAIENQAFVVAPAQCGQHSPDRSSYGRSMIVDPWGLVLARAGDRPSAIVADCDLVALEALRSDLPALQHRRL